MLRSSLKQCGILAMAITAVSLSSSAFAEGTSGWGFSGTVDNISVDSKVADSQYIGHSLTAVSFAGERYNSENNRTFNVGLNILMYDDKAGFSQTTQSSWGGDVQESDSSARGFLLFADYGPRFKFGQDQANYVTARGGFSAMLSSDRSIGNCTDCDTQDIEVDGGLYGLVGVGHSFGSFTLGVQLTQYLSGDLGTGVGIKLASSY